MTLTVLSRTYCHLCDDMIAALETCLASNAASAARIEIIDIDQHPDLEAAWGDKVPVLLADGSEICRYFFDAAKLIAKLNQSTVIRS
jgi:thioredoxin reductase (NADPH)